MTTNLNFGQAIEAAKQGKLIAREGWNGKGMFVFQRPSDELASSFIIDKVQSLPESFKKIVANNASVNPLNKDQKIKFSAYLCMFAADGSVVNGWLASQTDMLSEDWQIVE